MLTLRTTQDPGQAAKRPAQTLPGLVPALPALQPTHPPCQHNSNTQLITHCLLPLARSCAVPSWLSHSCLEAASSPSALRPLSKNELNLPLHPAIPSPALHFHTPVHVLALMPTTQHCSSSARPPPAPDNQTNACLIHPPLIRHSCRHHHRRHIPHMPSTICTQHTQIGAASRPTTPQRIPFLLIRPLHLASSPQVSLPTSLPESSNSKISPCVPRQCCSPFCQRAPPHFGVFSLP